MWKEKKCKSMLELLEGFGSRDWELVWGAVNTTAGNQAERLDLSHHNA